MTLCEICNEEITQTTTCPICCRVVGECCESGEWCIDCSEHAESGCSPSVRPSETYRHSPKELKPAIPELASLGELGSLSVRQIICRCPPGWKFCDCDDLAINRKNR